jgi:3-hydroxybenzoate 6-monooxygenase
VSFSPHTRIERIEQDEAAGPSPPSTRTAAHRGQALIGADGGKVVVRQQYVNDPPRVTGHVVYRAVVDKADFPADLRWNAASLWAGPKCHLVHYPLRGGEQYNVVVTFHSRQQGEWGVTDGSKEEVESYFQGICPKARQLIELPKSWKRWATADREPIATWTFGRATLLGDAAHPTTQYMAQGACMAHGRRGDAGRGAARARQRLGRRLQLYQRNRVPAPRASC